MTSADPALVRRGLGQMVLATVLFFGMSASVKQVAELPTLEIVFFRALFSLVLGGLWLRWEGVSPWGRHRGLLVLRGLFGTVSLICYFASLQNLPLATATILQNLSPLFTGLLAWWWLGERLTWRTGVLFALALLGVALVSGGPAGGDAVFVGIAVVGAALSAGSYLSIALLGEREHPLVIVFWFPLVTVPLVLPLLPPLWIWPSAQQSFWLVAIGLCVQTAQVAMTRAYQWAPAGRAALTAYLGVVWATVGGWLLFGEVLGPRELIGVVLVTGAVAGTRWLGR